MNSKLFSSWSIGQKVICIDDAFPRVAAEWFDTLPIAGHIYTIRATQIGRYGVTNSGCLGFLLEEITNPVSLLGYEAGFAEARFIPWLDAFSETAHADKGEPAHLASAK